MLRPTLLAVLLLLAPLVAAGADSSETNAAGFRGAANHLAHQLDAWWAAGSGRAEASALPQEQQQLEETGMLRVRLQLPGDRSVVVGEGSTLEELVASLLEEQAGLRPTSIELVSVQHVVKRRISPWRSLARSVAVALCPYAYGRLPGCGAAEAAAGGAGLDASSNLLPLPSLSGSAAADAEQQQQQWEAMVAADGADGRAGGRRLMRLESIVEELLQQDPFPAATHSHPNKLFGPARTQAELQRAAQQAAAKPLQTVTVELVVTERETVAFLPWMTLVSGRRSRSSAGAEQALEVELLGDASAAELVVLAEQLGQPAGGAAHQAAGRKAAAGGRLAGASLASFLASFDAAAATQLHQHRHGSHGHRHHKERQQPVLRGASFHPLALTAVDAAFVAATVVGAVCAVLLLVDICRHGLLRRQEAVGSYPAGALVADGDSDAAEKQRQLLAPLVVVAADEVAAAKSAC